MKTRWEVRFEAWDVSILKNRRFTVRARPREQQNPPVPTGECEILIELDTDHRTDTLNDPDEVGKLRITVPGRPEETEAFACFLADEIKERLCFVARQN